jgi:hypothetical protein
MGFCLISLKYVKIELSGILLLRQTYPLQFDQKLTIRTFKFLIVTYHWPTFRAGYCWDNIKTCH